MEQEIAKVNFAAETACVSAGLTSVQHHPNAHVGVMTIVLVELTRSAALLSPSEGGPASPKIRHRLSRCGRSVIRLIVRFLAVLVLAGAFVAMVVDGTRSLAAGSAAIMPLGRTIATVMPDVFIKLRTAIETQVPILWDPILVTMLLLPTWVVLGGIGLVLLALTRRPASKIGYNRR